MKPGERNGLANALWGAGTYVQDDLTPEQTTAALRLMLRIGLVVGVPTTVAGLVAGLVSHSIKWGLGAALVALLLTFLGGLFTFAVIDLRKVQSRS